MNTPDSTVFKLPFSANCPAMSDIDGRTIDLLVSGMLSLIDAIMTFYLPVLQADSDTYFNTKITETEQKQERNRQTRRALKLPAQSRAKTPAARDKADAKRNKVQQERKKLDDEKAIIAKELSALKERKKAGSISAARSWCGLIKQMRNATYSIQDDNTVASPHMLDVFSAYQQMMEEFKRELVSCPEWYSELSAWLQLSQCVSGEYIKAAIAQLSLTSRMDLFPHDISWDQVYDNLTDENGTVNVPQGPFALWKLINQRGNKVKERATLCASLPNHPRIGGAELRPIEHVEHLLEDLRQQQVQKAYLSAPMGGVYNCHINGGIYNSGSKTDGVMLPVILDALPSGTKVTVIVHRISLTKDLHARIRATVKEMLGEREWVKVWHYQQAHYDSAQVLVTCVNSLSRQDIKTFMQDSPIVLVDEFSQVIDNFKLLETPDADKNESRKECYHKAMSIHDSLAHAIGSPDVTFIAMDADLEAGLLSPVIERTMTATKSKIFSIRHPECSLSPSARSKQANFHRNKRSRQRCEALIIDLCQKRSDAINRRSQADCFFIATDSRALTYSYASLCQSYDLKVCLFNADTTEAKDSDASKLLRKELSPNDFDVVIMSPTITSGCSWVTPQYTRGVIAACAVIPSYNLKQMVFRFRNVTQVDIFSVPAQFNDLPSEGEFNIDLATDLLPDFSYGSLYIALRQHRTVLEKEATQNQLKYLYWQLEDEGWGCATIDPTLEGSEEELTTKTNSSERSDRIMDAKQLSIVEYSGLTNKCSSHDDVLACARFRSTMYTAVSDLKTDIRLALSPTHNANTLRLIKQLFTATKPLQGALLNDIMTELFGSQWMAELMDGNTLVVCNSDIEKHILRKIDDEHGRHQLYRAGVFTTSKRWINRTGAPIRENAAVITCELHRGDRSSAWTAIEAQLDRSKYKMYPLHDTNILLVNISANRNKRLGQAILKRLLKQCGLLLVQSKACLAIGGEQNGQVMRMAERRKLSLQLKHKTNMDDGTIKSITLDCWPKCSKSGCTVIFPGHGRSVTVIGTDDIVQSFACNTFLTESLGLSLDTQNTVELTHCAREFLNPIVTYGVNEKTCADTLTIAEFAVPGNEVSFHLNGVILATTNQRSLTSADYCIGFLPVFAGHPEHFKAIKVQVQSTPIITQDSAKEKNLKV